MSKAKSKQAPHPNPLQRSRTDKILEFNELFQTRKPSINDPSQTMATANPRGDGTYSAPEARNPNGKVQAESDTWSLGCVLFVVFSYLDNGARGVEKFSDLRAELPRDQFFTISAGKPRLSHAVERWMKELRARAHRRNKKEGTVVKDFLSFLCNSVLVVDPEKRKKTRARDIVSELGRVLRSYENLAELFPGDHQAPPQPSSANKKTHKRTFSLPFSRRRSLPLPAAPPNANRWKIPLPDVAKATTCEFGPNGEILVYILGSTLVAYSPRVVLDTGDVEDLIEFGSEDLLPKGYRWNTIAVSSQYIVAASNQPLFDVSL
jgi:serine/threonine protein kinase